MEWEQQDNSGNQHNDYFAALGKAQKAKEDSGFNEMQTTKIVLGLLVFIAVLAIIRILWQINFNETTIIKQQREMIEVWKK